MFPGEKVNHNAICSNCSKDCGNSNHEWLHKKELTFCSETKTWWLAFMANSKVLPLLKLLEVLGAREIRTFGHRSKGSLHEIFCTIRETVLDQINDHISDSGSVGLLCDDVTDVATLEQMLTFVQYVHSRKVSVRFLTIDNLLAKSTSATAGH
ncbi:unnamed protein product [Porites lobata]|uniref:Uncharacterized protein n=1 Tax=Porites lobata TaxID=104759 RepID=A0ABN8P3G4_9CNID|nr:unnamed protein product [Porites lobata]